MLPQHEASQKKSKPRGVERVLLENAFESHEVLLPALRLSRRRHSCCYLQGRVTVEILPEMFRFRKAAMGVKEKIYKSLRTESPLGTFAGRLLAFSTLATRTRPANSKSLNSSGNAVVKITD